MKTGIKELDQLIPIEIGDLIVIGSSTAMGKSSLMRQIGITHAMNGGKTLIWCGEHHPVESFVLCLCQLAEVQRNKLGNFRGEEQENILQIIDGRMGGGECLIHAMEYQRLVSAYNELFEMDIEFYQRKRDEDPFDVLESIYDKEHDDFLVIIDYIQLLVWGKEGQTEDLSRFMAKLREITVNTNTIFLVGSQVHRRVEERPSHRPYLPDLKDSSSIGEIANKVLFLYRRDYYDPHDKPGLAEIIIAKRSDGPCGSVCCTFRKEIGEFYNWEPNAP